MAVRRNISSQRETHTLCLFSETMIKFKCTAEMSCEGVCFMLWSSRPVFHIASVCFYITDTEHESSSGKTPIVRLLKLIYALVSRQYSERLERHVTLIIDTVSLSNLRINHVLRSENAVKEYSHQSMKA